MAVDADRVEKELTEVMNSQWFETGPFMIEFAEGKVKVKGTHRFANGMHTIEITSIAAAT